MAVPVVSTSIGAEGLPVRHGEQLLIADNPEEQVAAICALLTDPQRAAALSAMSIMFGSPCTRPSLVF